MTSVDRPFPHTQYDLPRVRPLEEKQKISTNDVQQPISEVCYFLDQKIIIYNDFYCSGNRKDTKH